MFIAGDNAYVCSVHLLTPFSGEEKNDPRKDAYNFHLSQLRIRIEQTFGYMTTKWRISKRPLQVKQKNVDTIFLCITRLHNFCINEGDDVNSTIENRNDSTLFFSSDVSVTTVEGNSMLRDIIVDQLAGLGLGRPQRNMNRNIA